MFASGQNDAVSIKKITKWSLFSTTKWYHGDIYTSVCNRQIGVAVTGCGEWTPAIATEEIRRIAASKLLTISYKRHAVDRLEERGLIMSDALYVLKNGFVYDEPEASTRIGYHKYSMESRSPNSGRRSVRVIVIPDKKTSFLKIISVMWVDETETRAGSIIGDRDG